MITITVDDKQIDVKKGANLLQACLENGLYIPNLCYLENMATPFAACRLCWVASEGSRQPQTACTTTIDGPLIVRTDTPEVRQLQRAGLKLLLSAHRVDCKNCQANKKCALQNLAKFLKVPLKSADFEQTLKEPEIDTAHPFLDYYPNRCVLCGKCLHVCRDQSDLCLLSFAKRGIHTVISAYGALAVETIDCRTCKACADVCPVGALIFKGEARKAPRTED